MSSDPADSRAAHDGGAPFDPILTAIENFRVADEALVKLHETSSISMSSDQFEDAVSRLGDLRTEALEGVYNTEPSTTAGLVALVELFMAEDMPVIEGMAGNGIEAICRTVLTLFGREPE